MMKVENNAKLWLKNCLPLNIEITHFHTEVLCCRYNGKINNTLHNLLKECEVTYTVMLYGLFLCIPHRNITKINFEGL